MAAKYSRVDGRKSVNYCSTSTIVAVVFVSLCLVGLWMSISSSIVPTQNVNVPTNNIKNDKVQQTFLGKGSQQFEDSSGNLPQDALKDDEDIPDKDSENKDEGSLADNTLSDDSEETTDSVKEPEDVDLNSVNKETMTSKEEEEPNDSEKSESEHTVDQNQESDENKNKSDTQEALDKSKQSNEDEPDKDEQNNVSEYKTKKEQGSLEIFPTGAQSELLNETTTQEGAWLTQVTESKNERESQKSSLSKDTNSEVWKLCNVTAGSDYIPCLDNVRAIRKLTSTKHYEHRERHCPDEATTCLVALPKGYRRSVKWPKSRDKIWYNNVPNTKLAMVKGHQNWVKVAGDYLTFPGGGTQFKNGALHYIDFIEQSVPDIAWGKKSRVILDVGCGVASFGGFLIERDVLAMSFAPKDEHEAQVQFALERGIPAIYAVMGTKRLPFPGRVFDAVHCARCRVPWHVEGGKLLLELNRVLRPRGYFIWSATPLVHPKETKLASMSRLTKAMCWNLVTVKKDRLNAVGAAIYRKPSSNECYEKRSKNEPPLCSVSDDPNVAWNVTLEACMHRVPVEKLERGTRWPVKWPKRVDSTPYWLQPSQQGVYGKPAPEDFTSDNKHWKHVVSNSYLNGMGIDWSSIRNVMDMRAIYGGFAAALKDLKVWVMNVVPIDSPDTLPVIYERGLFGLYHDWCESFSTYPRSYDLLHADHLLSTIKERCNLVVVFAEIDRILRPEGKLIVRDDVETINEVESLVKSLHWEIRLAFSKDSEGLLCVEKTYWRPKESKTISYAIA
uniref:Uncharacterized protein n=1 Tax=Kalanchoe fedtschenkoi TaxID=63787 RepID=A0A7N0TZG1_KALFE